MISTALWGMHIVSQILRLPPLAFFFAPLRIDDLPPLWPFFGVHIPTCAVPLLVVFCVRPPLASDAPSQRFVAAHIPLAEIVVENA